MVHRGNIHDGVALGLGIELVLVRDPERLEPKDRIDALETRQVRLGVAGVDGQVLTGHDTSSAHFFAPENDPVLAAVEAEVVAEVDGRNDESQILDHLTTDTRDSLHEVSTLALVVDQLNEVHAKLDGDGFHRHEALERGLLVRLLRCS